MSSGLWANTKLSFRLDQKRKELTLRKEGLLKESKAQTTTMDSVKTQIDVLMKVGTLAHRTSILFVTILFRPRPKSKRKSTNSSYQCRQPTPPDYLVITPSSGASSYHARSRVVSSAYLQALREAFRNAPCSTPIRCIQIIAHTQ